MQDSRLVHPVVEGFNLQRELAARLSAADRPPTVKFLHLFDTHLPMVLDERCAFTGETVRWSRANYKVQVGCSLEAFRAVLGALRRAGVYDNTAIVLLGDHGTPGMVSTRVVPGGPGPVNGSVIGLANPALAVKPIDGRGAFRALHRAPERRRRPGDRLRERRGLCRAAEGSRGEPNAQLLRVERVPPEARPHPLDRRYAITGSLFDSRNWRRIDPAPVVK